MQVSAMTGATPLPGRSRTGGTAGQNPGQQIDYMKLIVAQMKNMNPLDPSSGGNGLATMMQAEELNQLNLLNKAFTTLQTLTQTGYASSLIGRRVTGTNGAGVTVSGIVTGVKMDPSGPLLSVGSQILPLLGVTSIETSGS
jgi:flagellar basal-body rod modification protein FlgD